MTYDEIKNQVSRRDLKTKAIYAITETGVRQLVSYGRGWAYVMCQGHRVAILHQNIIRLTNQVS